MNEDRKSPIYAGTALKALSVFDLIAESDRPMAIKDLIDRCGMPRATLHRMLSALVETGLVHYDREARTYWLGMRLIELAGKVWERIDLSGAFARELGQLRKLSGMNAQIAVIEGFQIVYIDERDSFDEVRFYYMKGRRHPAYCTAMGKAMLACLDQIELRRLVGSHEMTAYTKDTLTDLPALQVELALTRERQYAIDDEELEVGRRCVASAILDHSGRAIAAIGLTGPAGRLSKSHCHELGPELIAAGQRITRALGQLGDSVGERPRRVSAAGDPRVRCAFAGTSFIADSPVWSERSGELLWVDILAPAIHTGNPSRRDSASALLPSLVGSIALRSSGGLIAAFQNGIGFVSDRYEVDIVAAPEADRPQNRMNDGKCDSHGRFWVSSMSMLREPGKGSLYRFDPDQSLHTVQSGLSILNGPDWSPEDDRMYLTDSLANRLIAYPYDPNTGSLGEAKTLLQLPQDKPVMGGIAVDVEGFIWTAMWDGSEVLRIAPDGRIVTRISIPVPRPTGVTFGGDDFDTLYVTSSRIRMSATQIEIAPLSGSVFAIDVGVCGRRPNEFTG